MHNVTTVYTYYSYRSAETTCTSKPNPNPNANLNPEITQNAWIESYFGHGYRKVHHKFAFFRWPSIL